MLKFVILKFINLIGQCQLLLEEFRKQRYEILFDIYLAQPDLKMYIISKEWYS